MEIDVLQLLRISLKFRRCFEDDVILIELRIKRADLALPKRVIER